METNNNKEPKYANDQVLQTLIDNLDSENLSFAISEANALGNLGDPRAANALYEKLINYKCYGFWKTNDSIFINSLAHSLYQLRATDLLIDVIKNGRDSDVRIAAIRHLGFNGITKAIDLLLEKAKFDGPEAEAALKALIHSDDERAIEALLKATHFKRNPSVRKTALFGLGIIRDPRAIPILKDILDNNDSKDFEVKNEALKSLANFGEHITLYKYYKKFINKKDFISCLGINGNKTTAKLLIKILVELSPLENPYFDSDKEIRKLIIETLVKIGEIDPLIEFLETQKKQNWKRRSN